MFDVWMSPKCESKNTGEPRNATFIYLASIHYLHIYLFSFDSLLLFIVFIIVLHYLFYISFWFSVLFIQQFIDSNLQILYLATM